MANLICEKCAVPITECSWMSKLRPIPGWKARRTENSYHITGCPKFVPAPKVADDKPSSCEPTFCVECGKLFLRKLVPGPARKYCDEVCRRRAAKKRMLEKEVLKRREKK